MTAAETATFLELLNKFNISEQQEIRSLIEKSTTKEDQSNKV